MTVRARYADALNLSGRASSTIKLRLRGIDRFVATLDGGWRDATGNQVATFLLENDWQSKQTRRVFHATIASFYAWAVSEGLIAEDPSERIPKITSSLTANTLPASREAIRAAIATSDNRTSMMIKLAYVAGLKVQEIAAVHRSHVFDDGHGGYLLTAHRGHKVRNVPLPDSLADEIRASTGFVFPGREKGHLSAAYVSKLISIAMPGGETAEQVRLAHQRALERNVAVDVWRDVANFHSPANLRLLDSPRLRSSRDLQRHLDHISRDIDVDPAAAIDHSKRLLESLFKLVLADIGEPASDSLDLPALYRAVRLALGIDSESIPGDKRASDAVEKAVRNAIATVQSVGEMRNAFDGHGRHDGPKCSPIHARLAFNACVTAAEFVGATWAARRGLGELPSR